MNLRTFFLFTVILALAGCSKKSATPDVLPSPADTTTNNGSPRKWTVTTIAGNGTASFVNGNALSASFHFPEDVATGTDGSIYVTDVANFCIRKIFQGGVSTYAGGAAFNIINGEITSAQFKSPFSITVSQNGDVFTTDDNDPRIRKISIAKQVSTYAGLAQEGFVNGYADTARFKSGAYIACDATGTVYISEAMNNSIRKISTTGLVTTIAANYQFSSPAGIAIDKENNLYVANRFSYNVLKITPAGAVSIVAGSGTPGFKDGNPNEAQFSGDVRDLAIDKQGNIYLSDDNRIRKINSQGIVSTIAGSTKGFNDGEGSLAKFDFPNGLAIDDRDNLYVADLNNNRIRKISFE
jgi:sugar lactone lactonase YvrE